MGILKFIAGVFGYELHPKHDSDRKHVKDVKSGDIITIEWDKIHNKIGDVLCLNNDLKTKKIFLEMEWDNNENEQFILSYYSKELKNFHLLNAVQKDKINDDFDVSKLQNAIRVALKNEEYEKIMELQNKVDKINKILNTR